MSRPNVVFVDVETTGFYPDLHEIIEIGAVVVTPDLSMELGHVSLRVLPTSLQHATEEALRINGYDPELWDETGLELDDALSHLARMVTAPRGPARAESDLAGAPMMAGQNIGFDERFLRRAFEKSDRAWPFHTHRTFDLIGLCWPLYARGDVSSMSLDSLCAHFGIERPPVHRALADARAALEVARQMMGRYQGAA